MLNMSLIPTSIILFVSIIGSLSPPPHSSAHTLGTLVLDLGRIDYGDFLQIFWGKNTVRMIYRGFGGRNSRDLLGIFGYWVPTACYFNNMRYITRNYCTNVGYYTEKHDIYF